ncbi:MAG: HAD-IIB family hydrolase [Balneola sp.]|nr:MAG: HAD-IIB family hydrolase [Balneola sp.]
MIRLFITDLDGCVTDPFETPDWEAYSELRRLNLKSIEDHDIPPLTICTGRPMPYAEAQALMLRITVPFIFESGGGMYDVKKNELIWSPSFNKDAERHVNEIKAWSHEQILPNFEGVIPEFAKHTDIGFIHKDSSVIDKIYKQATDLITSNYESFEVHKTDVSVNIIQSGANKGKGIAMLCDYLGIELDEVAYIGDSSGDIPGLKIVGMPFSPANAIQATKNVSEVMKGQSTKAVVEAYQTIIERNKKR